MTQAPPLPPMDETLLDVLPVPACICEAPSGLIIGCNPDAIALWGQRPQTDTRIHEVLQFVRPDGTHLPHDETPLVTAVSEGIAAANQQAVIERPGGARVRVTLNILPFKRPRQMPNAGLLVFHGAPALVRRDALLSGQKRALELIVRGGPLEHILDALTDIVEQQSEGSTVAAIRLLDPDGLHLHHAGASALPDSYKRAIDGLEIGPDAGTCGAAASLRQAVVAEDIEQAGEWASLKHLPLGLGFHAVWSMPILSSSRRVLGTFATYFRERRPPSPVEREMVELLSHTAAIAIERRRAADVARETDRRKDEFLAMLAHELRAPLAPIGTAAQLLSFTDRDSTIVDRARTVIERQVRNMTRLIDDLLDVSRITRGVVELQRTTIDVAQLAARAVETVSPLVQTRNHRLTVSVPDGPILVCADATRMEQVIVNLLMNAAKFTATGGHIALRVAARGDDMVTIRVTDNGRGIAPDLIPRVFDMFTQGGRTLDRSEGGLGVGLTVAQRLAEMHGGSISVRSEGAGCGSEFTVTLPRAPGAALDEAPARPLPSSQACRVLIVEDERDAAETLALLLAAQSHEVRVVTDGHAALVEAARFHPDVMLVDIGLSGMSGYDLAERLRSDRILAHVFLVAVTGYDRPQDRTRALSSGFDRHVAKPVDARTLGELIADALQSRTDARHVLIAPGSSAASDGPTR